MFSTVPPYMPNPRGAFEARKQRQHFRLFRHVNVLACLWMQSAGDIGRRVVDEGAGEKRRR
jgi:hypothetical protein